MQLFVSYARTDRPRVESLVMRLRQAGIEVWLDSDLVGGQEWWDRILAQVRSCDAVLAAISKDALRSGTCRSEREYAARLGKPTLPVVLEPITIDLVPPDLARLQMIDYSKPGEAAAFQLIGAVFRLPRPVRLPDPLPAPPAVPTSVMVTMVDRVSAPQLSRDQQLAIITRLEQALGSDGDPAEREIAIELLGQMAMRSDLFAVSDRRIQELLRHDHGRSAIVEPGPAAEPPGAGPEPRPGATAVGPPVPGPIFISYRREDKVAAYVAGSLYERLTREFGEAMVFQDIDSIEPGDDFVEKINSAVESCAVLLALIGDGWLEMADEAGQRRLDDPEDFVRLEIEAALARNVRVIPVLVGEAKQPSSRQLPKELALLARRQAQPLRANQLAIDTGRLLKVLEKTFAERQSPPASQRPLSVGRPWSVSSGESRVFAGDSHDHQGQLRRACWLPWHPGSRSRPWGSPTS